MTPKIVHASPGTAVHRAGWVIAAPDRILRDGYVAVDSGRITDAGAGADFPRNLPVTDHGPGAILPLLVNAHTHLELSALAGKVPFDRGFREWVRRLLAERAAAGPEALAAGVEKGIDALAAGGCGAVGEVSTLGITWAPLRASGLCGVWFREFLGSPGDGADTAMPPSEPLLTSAVAGHAPHTTDPAWLQRLKDVSRHSRRPFSIHLDESDDELAFLTTGRGPWADFLRERGIDFSGWAIPDVGPVQYADRLGILDEKTLAVHLIHAGRKEFDILRRRGARVCLCPRSNQNLHGRLPDLPGMIDAGLAPCLGTDSLAGTESLSMFDEMAFCARAYPGISPETILALATRNGAAALHLGDHFGSLAPGKSAGLCYLPVTASTPSALLERIVHDLSN
ncbi:amidohydrolase family protein [Desulfococcus sp.]|uniref:amidohydrolase family protein n=1 Tax=Desulfococcus sp. TaxID=2025834 RepID=UPI003593C933